MSWPRFQSRRTCVTLWVAQAALACSPAPGDVSVLIEPESTIQTGIPAGSGPDQILDGWDVSFDKYVVTLGPVQLSPLSGGEAVEDGARWAVDLVQVPTRGEPLWTFAGLAEGRHDLRFHTTSADNERHASVTSADFERLTGAGLTHIIVGTLSSESGLSCPPASLATPPDSATAVDQNAAGDPCYQATALSFSIEARAEVSYGPCSIDGLRGVAVRAGETATAAISMHGDHLFFGGFPEGSEGAVGRYAQWLADSDLDLDGQITSGELATIPPSALPELDERFPLGGSPIRPIDNLLTYVESQLSTQGHFEGEGECAIGFETPDQGLGGAAP